MARLQQQAPLAFFRPRTAGKHFMPSEMHREVTPDPLQGRPEPQAREALLGWLRVSGRVGDTSRRRPGREALPCWRPGKTPRDSGADGLWTTLAALDEQDTELYRHHALLTAVAWARENGVSADAADRQQAERDIAAEHGVESFPDLQTELAPYPEFLAEVNRYRELLGLAKRVRVAWFGSATPGRGPHQAMGAQAAR